MWRCRLVPAVLIVMAAAACPARAPAEVRLLVKYRAALDACIECLVNRGASLAPVSGDKSLDQLHARLRVARAEPLIAHLAERASPRAAYGERVERTRARWPARAARAPRAAIAPDLSSIYVLRLDTDLDADTAARLYARNTHVAWAEPDRILEASFIPDDPYFGTTGAWGQTYGNLWGLDMLQAPTAWDVATGVGSVVAVIDTGVDPTHPDLAANMWRNPGEIPNNNIDDDGNGFVDDVWGWDFYDNDADPNDLNGHGTHVAGTIAAVGNNGIGIVGVAFGSSIMAVRGLGADGWGTTSDLARAMVYAVENGADVLNNSWGGRASQTIADAVATAQAAGVVVVAAAGNSGGSVTDFTPAGIDGVIAVGALQYDGQLASFSNHGDGQNDGDVGTSRTTSACSFR